MDFRKKNLRGPAGGAGLRPERFLLIIDKEEFFCPLLAGLESCLV
jgi:hypothetical protein